MYRITIRETNFECSQDSDLLRAARKNLIKIPCGCYSGGCGMCKMKVVSGEYRLGVASMAVLPEEERKQGYVLACKTFPLSHMIVEDCEKTG